MKRPLNELDELHASKQLKQNTLQHVMQKEIKHKSRGVSLGLFATACLCLLFFIYQGNTATTPSPIVATNKEVYSYISVDINPSFELSLNKDNKVVQIITFNDDAKELLQEYEFEDKDAQTVVKEIISLPKFQPYLDQGYLQVSVFSEDTSTSSQIEETLQDTLAQVLEQDQYTCTCASKQEKEGADEHHMSFGKYRIVDEIIMKDSSYTIEDLQAHSMMELKAIYEELYQSKYQGNQHGNQGHGHGNKHK